MTKEQCLEEIDKILKSDKPYAIKLFDIGLLSDTYAMEFLKEYKEKVKEEISKYILSEHNHFSEEMMFTFKKDEPYINSLEFENDLDQVLNNANNKLNK